MGERCSKLDLNPMPKKSGMRCNDDVDWISQLPDDFIINILSFLSLKDAATTSVLSSRWRPLWKYIPNLIFETSYCEDIKRQEKILKYVNWVNSVLELHRAPSLKDLSISFPLVKSNQQDVSKWFRFALFRRAERVKLNFCKIYRNPCENAIVLEDILRESNVASFELKFLKHLSLESLKISGEDIKLILGSFPSLEVLKICWPIITSDLEINSGSLRHLCMYYHGKRYSTKIAAPNLTIMDSRYYPKLLSFENVSKLVDACFVVGAEHVMGSFANVGSLLESLTLHIFVPKMFWGFAETPKLKKLILNCNKMGINGACQNIFLPLTRILRASPRLVVLQIEFYPTNQGVFKVPKDKCTHDHLKVFQFSGFRVDADDHIKLLRYIVENCVVLERVSITPPLPKFSYHDSEDDAHETTKEYTRQHLAAKFDVPDHIKLSIV